MLSPAFVEISKALAQVPFVARIETEEDYERALELMDQHGLGVANLPELGSKGNVSKILNGAERKKLTCKHMEAFGKRFGVPPTPFL
ncbi:hypothetical protein [Marinobacter nauticus]|uniref:Transcriptional regulator n=1 Tax=Marinobacter nauticus TaxID=2743 RepID=A0A1M2UW02_MARNT|nr:hypothetical protein [Marinobacter nauticus]OJS99539.1 hypothetical protein BEE62_05255 [Marinobacter nauticus]